MSSRKAHHIAVVAADVVVRHEVGVVARREAALEALEVGVVVRHVQHLHHGEGGEVEAHHLAAGAVVVRHEVAVGALREAAEEALEVGVYLSRVRHHGIGHVQHRHRGEGGEVEAHHLAVEGDVVVLVRHEVAVDARHEAAAKALEVSAAAQHRGHVQHINA